MLGIILFAAMGAIIAYVILSGAARAGQAF